MNSQVAGQFRMKARPKAVPLFDSNDIASIFHRGRNQSLFLQRRSSSWKSRQDLHFGIEDFRIGLRHGFLGRSHCCFFVSNFISLRSARWRQYAFHNRRTDKDSWKGAWVEYIAVFKLSQEG
jgi:hypothetical protein